MLEGGSSRYRTIGDQGLLQAIPRSLGARDVAELERMLLLRFNQDHP